MYDKRDDFFFDIILRITAKLIDPTGKLNTYNNWKKSTRSLYGKNPFVTERKITYNNNKVNNNTQEPINNYIIENLNNDVYKEDYEVKIEAQDNNLTDNKVKLQISDSNDNGIALDFNLNQANLAQAFIYSEIIGKPRCQTRRRR